MIGGILGKGKKVNIEIERKFLVRAKPNEKPLRKHHIRQGYIAREGGNVVRVRVWDDRYILSVKTPTKGVGRYEIEVDIKAHEAKVLLAACPHAPLEKTREVYGVGGHMWEVDFFKGPNKGLIIAEVELSSEQEEFTLPDWIGPEVTGLQKFYNANLSVNSFKNWGVTYGDLVARLDGV